ncbi:hypothetical protein LAJ19_17165 (plasmid) [Deinococcus taeanensis]|uniref:hypothetical protein n=1 Tax=Deinococcus taeanensis TaxID=2737050 RepID=UPI001CDD2003|nr:hypothetical protein [Deinococcus taeanensis]UBV44509.1 hypothetical protein LAJ19_17165 [Deinococcus taeanensis]
MLASHMEECHDRGTLVSATGITLVGQAMQTTDTVATSKGVVTAPVAYQVLHRLKGHEAPEYAVTRDELKALNATAIDTSAASDDLRAFWETLTRLNVPQ